MLKLYDFESITTQQNHDLFHQFYFNPTEYMQSDVSLLFRI